MPRAEIQELERLMYWQGQRLKSRDFRDQAAGDALLRAWHNRSLHETGGTVFGFAVTIDAGRIHVTRGLAYDRSGRAVWLARDVELGLPAGTATQSFVVVAAPNGCGATADCGCGCGGHGKEAAVAIVPAGSDLPPGLLLAEIVAGAPPTLDRCVRFVRPLDRPRVALGETVRDDTPWEVWSERFTGPDGSRDVPVGVQTRVDTAAAGFTTVPHYFATPQSDPWSAASLPGQPRPEFLPVYFAHIAKPETDGFVLRLLLKDIARRQYLPRTPEAVLSSERSVAVVAPNRLQVQGTGFGQFAVGDRVVLARPRPPLNARASAILTSDDNILTVSPTIRGERLVLGNLPRASRVVSTRTDGVSVFTVASAAGLRRHDVLAMFPTGGAAPVSARIRRVNANRLVLSRLVAGAAAGSEYRTGAIAGAPKISAPPTTGAGGAVNVQMKGSLTDFARDEWVVVITSAGASSAPIQLAQVAATSLTFRSGPAELRTGSRVVLLGPVKTLDAADTDDTGLTAIVESAALFEEGDVVAAADRAPLAVIRTITANDILLEGQPGFTVAEGESLVAANWKGTLIPYFVFATGGALSFALARFADLVRPGDVVTVLDPAAGQFEPRPEQLARVAVAASTHFAPATPMPGLTPGSFVVCGEFPARATVSTVNADGRITVNSTRLRTGDWVAVLVTAPGAAIQVAQVTAIEPDGRITLSQPIDNLAPGLTLGVVHFRESASVETIQPDGTLELTAPLTHTRPGDFVALWDHHADSSAAGIIRSIGAANASGLITVTIGPTEQTPAGGGAPAELQGLPGMLPRGLIDRAEVAYASLTPEQPTVRLQEGALPQPGDDLTVSGPSPTGVTQTLGMTPSSIDQDRLTLALRLGAAAYAIRPEQLSMLSDFTDRFPSDFAVFAHRQKLSVSWLAIEHQPCPAADLPEPAPDPCAGETQEEKRCH